jgi:1-acyl-sn-glycerol-3-phosphate acyltransferase
VIVYHGFAASSQNTGVETVPKRSWEEGRLLRWLHRSQQVAWGTDPGEFSAETVRRTLPYVKKLYGPGRYFGVDVSGWENVPEAPVMIVANHSGGTTIPDVWGFIAAWYQNFGVHRPLHPMAHEIILSTRLTGEFFARRGVLRGSRPLALSVLRDWKRDLMVMPGGDLDTWRPWSARYQVRFSGRTGYARTALQAGVPIIPVAHEGAHSTLFVISDGRRLARALHLQELARASIWPVHFSLPWGLAIGPWPHLPTPARFRYRIGPAVAPPARVAPGAEPDEELVRAYDRSVQAAVQRLLDELKATAW